MIFSAKKHLYDFELMGRKDDVFNNVTMLHAVMILIAAWAALAAFVFMATVGFLTVFINARYDRMHSYDVVENAEYWSFRCQPRLASLEDLALNSLQKWEYFIVSSYDWLQENFGMWNLLWLWVPKSTDISHWHSREATAKIQITDVAH